MIRNKGKNSYKKVPLTKALEVKRCAFASIMSTRNMKYSYKISLGTIDFIKDYCYINSRTFVKFYEGTEEKRCFKE
jgi:hypothetical protein